MWDNREGKRNPKAPDFKCKDRECGGVIWPSRTTRAGAPPETTPAAPAASSAPAAPARPALREAGSARSKAAEVSDPRVSADGMPLCPLCGGTMWDDRLSKRNPRAPDFKCRNRPRERGGPGCEGVIWPSRDGAPSPYPPPVPRRQPPAPPGAGGPPAADRPPAYDGPPPEDRPVWDDDEPPF